jgi:hypothetical protein
MTASQLKQWSEGEYSKAASQGRSPITRNLELLSTPKDKWTAKHIRWAKKTIGFVARMKEAGQGEPVSKDIPYSKRDISLKNWAYDPKSSSDHSESLGFSEGVNRVVMRSGAIDFRAVIDRVVKSNGLEIGLEYLPGGVRFPGTKHSKKLRCGYGHIRGYQGNDKEALDCYVHPDVLDGVEGAGDRPMFAVSQLSPEDGDFNEYKIMIGWESADAAEQAYLREMPEEYFGGIEEGDREWLQQFHKSASFEESIDFARLKLAGNTQQIKNCTKGWPCGFTCLSRAKKNCKRQLEGQSADLQQWLEKSAAATPKDQPQVTTKTKRLTLDDALKIPKAERPSIVKIGDSFKEKDAPYIVEEGPYGDRKRYAEDAYTDSFMIRSQNSGQLARYYAVMSDGTTQGLDSAFMLSKPEHYSKLKRKLTGSGGGIDSAAREYWKLAGEEERTALANDATLLGRVKELLPQSTIGSPKSVVLAYDEHPEWGRREYLVIEGERGFRTIQNIDFEPKTKGRFSSGNKPIDEVLDEESKASGLFFDRQMPQYWNADAIASGLGVKRLPDVSVPPNTSSVSEAAARRVQYFRDKQDARFSTDSTPAKPRIELKDAVTPDDRAKYARQELELARQSGDRTRISKWEAEAKRTRQAALEAEQQRLSQTQTSLFGVDEHSNLPLFNFSEDRALDIAAIFAEQAIEQAKPAIAQWTGTIQKLINEVASGSGSDREKFIELQERLPELYPRLSIVEFADVLGAALSAAEGAGRYEVIEGLGVEEASFEL